MNMGRMNLGGKGLPVPAAGSSNYMTNFAGSAGITTPPLPMQRQMAMMPPLPTMRPQQPSFASNAYRERVYQQKSQFMQFGALPSGFENVMGNRGILGKPVMVAASGAQPFGGGFSGGGFSGGSSYSGGGSYSSPGTTPVRGSGGSAVTVTPHKFSGNNEEAFREIYKVARSLGKTDAQARTAAAVAMHESAWLKSSMWKRANNPFGQTVLPSQIGKRGIVGSTRGADKQGHAVYATLRDAVKHHFEHSRWSKIYNNNPNVDPVEIARQLRSAGYNSVNPGWLSGVARIARGAPANLQVPVTTPQTDSSSKSTSMGPGYDDMAGLGSGVENNLSQSDGIKVFQKNAPVEYKGKDDITKKPLTNVQGFVAHDVSGAKGGRVREFRAYRRYLEQGMSEQEAYYKAYHSDTKDPIVRRAYHDVFGEGKVHFNPLDTQRPHAFKYNKSMYGISHLGFEGVKLNEKTVATGAAAVMRQYLTFKQQNPNVTLEQYLARGQTHPGLGTLGTKSPTGKVSTEGSWLKKVKDYFKTDKGKALSQLSMDRLMNITQKELYSGKYGTSPGDLMPGYDDMAGLGTMMAPQSFFSPQELQRSQNISERVSQVPRQSLDQLVHNLSTKQATGGGLVNETQTKVAGIRKLKLPSRTKRMLQYAAGQAGVEVDVYSGAQDIKGATKRGKYWYRNGKIVGIGSTRHGLQTGAADVKLYIRDKKTGERILVDPARNSRHGRIYADFMRAASKAGATGIGYGRGYMGASIHVGFGGTATWGGGMRPYMNSILAGRRERFSEEEFAKMDLSQAKVTRAQEELTFDQLKQMRDTPQIALAKTMPTIFNEPENRNLQAAYMMQQSQLADIKMRAIAYDTDKTVRDNIEGAMVSVPSGHPSHPAAQVEASGGGAELDAGRPEPEKTQKEQIVAIGDVEAEVESESKKREQVAKAKDNDSKNSSRTRSAGGQRGSGQHHPEQEAPRAGSSGYGASGRCWV